MVSHVLHVLYQRRKQKSSQIEIHKRPKKHIPTAPFDIELFHYVEGLDMLIQVKMRTNGIPALMDYARREGGEEAEQMVRGAVHYQ